MREIALTRGMVALVDDIDFERMNAFRWHAAVVKNTCYAARWTQRNGKEGAIYMHRAILGIDDSSTHVDHKDHNGLNNIRSNLRKASRLLNNRNRRSQSGSTSRFVGVCWNKTYKIWQAQIDINGKQTHLGRFDSEIEAALARDQAARKHYGEFAHLNFP